MPKSLTRDIVIMTVLGVPLCYLGFHAGQELYHLISGL